MLKPGLLNRCGFNNLSMVIKIGAEKYMYVSNKKKITDLRPGI
jgi:hypothetical protein